MFSVRLAGLDGRHWQQKIHSPMASKHAPKPCSALWALYCAERSSHEPCMRIPPWLTGTIPALVTSLLGRPCFFYTNTRSSRTLLFISFRITTTTTLSDPRDAPHRGPLLCTSSWSATFRPLSCVCECMTHDPSIWSQTIRRPTADPRLSRSSICFPTFPLPTYLSSPLLSCLITFW